MEGAEADVCYVCLEECDTTSPCRCGQPLHMQCLLELQNTDIRCTICKSRFTNLYEEMDESESEVNPYVLAVGFATSLFGLYISAGYLGKCLLIPFWGTNWNDDFLPFWTMKHCLCSVSFILLMMILSKIYDKLK